MTRRNISSNDVEPLRLIAFEYPSQAEIEAMVREAHQMRALALRDTFRWLKTLVTRRRASAPEAASAPAKA